MVRLMRICIDLTSLDDNFSGIERYAACLSKEMIKDESNEFILVFKNKVHSLFEEQRGNVKNVIIPGCKKLWFNQIRLPLVINKIKADYYLFLAFPVPVILFKKNMISTIHDICCWDCPETMNWLSKWYFRISHRVALKKCKAIITISHFSEKRIIEKLKYPQNKVWLVYCGVENKFSNFNRAECDFKELRKKYNLPEEYFLSLCTLEPRKNLRLLIDAYSLYCTESDNGLPLVLAGRKGWKVDSLLDGLDVNVLKNIIFTGFIDDEDLPAIYGYASCFVFSSKYEGFGMPPLEAIACGTPVISSDAASMPEVLGDNAIYFRSNDKDCLVSVLCSNGTTKIRHKDSKKVALEYSWVNSASKLSDFLKDEKI